MPDVNFDDGVALTLPVCMEIDILLDGVARMRCGNAADLSKQAAIGEFSKSGKSGKVRE